VADEPDDRPQQDGSSPEEATEAGRIARVARKLDRDPRFLAAVKRARQLLPGDSRFGDPLSTSGSKAPHVVGRRLSTLTAESPGLSRELGLGALQVWQALSEAQGRGMGDEELAILFTDLVGFSDWALEAGDARALELLRDVGEATEPPIEDHGGEVVKRLGDGVLAVMPDAHSAIDATFEACERLGDIEVDGYHPQLRAGLHVGRPRKLGGDYLGVDVNIAARLIEQAGGDEILVSDRALADLDTKEVEAKRLRRFKAKGAPSELTAYAVKRPGS
jgi:adenylate cyclase